MSFQTLNPAGVQALLAQDPEYVYLDVRSVQEFEQGHVPGSFNIPLLFMTPAGMQPNPGFLAAVQRRFAKPQKLVLGCKAGGRSERACMLLAGQGYTTLVNMAGGFHGATDMSGSVLEPGWVACGFETSKSAQPGHSWKELAAG